MPEVTVNQRTEEWMEARQGKVTASLAAACLGLDPYISARMAWRKILSMEENYQNRFMRFGVVFEPTARLEYETKTGNLATECGLWVHPELPWLAASPDGLIGTDGLVEVKCPMKPPVKVPIHHRIQCLIQLACTGRKWCDYYSWGAKSKVGEEPVDFLSRVHRAGIPGLILRLKRFYDSYVVTGIEPPAKARKKRKT